MKLSKKSYTQAMIDLASILQQASNKHCFQYKSFAIDPTSRLVTLPFVHHKVRACSAKRLKSPRKCCQ